MSETHENPDFSEDESESRVEAKHLKPISRKFPLPHEGYIEARYWLKKGGLPRYGCHPDGKSIESHFSTQDDATLELILENKSPYHIRHARVFDVKLMSYVGKGDRLESPDTELEEPNGGKRLPDGNAFIEIVPSDGYFGHLDPNQSIGKSFSVITRGTKPGNYVICMTLDYSVDNCDADVHLPLKVKRD
jgi:hypothetical protein